jgi:hypothetical protein
MKRREPPSNVVLPQAHVKYNFDGIQSKKTNKRFPLNSLIQYSAIFDSCTVDLVEKLENLPAETK